MERTTEILIIDSVDQIPTIESILEIPRSKKLKLLFSDEIRDQRESIGQKLKKELKGFLVCIHVFEQQVDISKLITDEEIADNQLFFENCAKDYRKLSGELINQLAHKLKVKIDPMFPLLTFNPMKGDNRQRGKINGWHYFLHGAHCGFENKTTRQVVETPLIYGLEFGVLDPYFFTRFIKSTLAYNPLPIDIYEDYDDGVRINEVMLLLNRFEDIGSNIENQRGIVVAERDKIKVEVYEPYNKEIKKDKPNLKHFFGLDK